MTEVAALSTGDVAERMKSIADGRRWGRLVDAARKRTSSSSDGAANRDARLLRAQALLAGLLLELPGERGGVSRNAMMRSTLAVIGKMWIEDEAGYDSVILTHELLALGLGCASKTASRALRDLMGARLITRSRGGAWIAGRYRIVGLRSRDRIADIVPWRADIEALVDGERSTLRTLVLSVTHPTWSHSSVLTHHHWLMLLTDVACIDPERFGIRPEMRARLRRELTARYELTAGTVEPFLMEILDRLADDPECGVDGETARARKVRAATEFEERVAQRRADRERVRVVKKETYAVLDQLLGMYPVPASPLSGRRDTRADREDTFMAWVDEVRAEVILGQPGVYLRQRLTEALASRLEHTGYPAKFAYDTASFLMQADPGTSLEKWLDRAGAGRDWKALSQRQGRSARW